MREMRRQRLDFDEASSSLRDLALNSERVPEAGSPSASRRRQTKAAKAKGNRTNRKFQRRLLDETAGTGEEGVDFDDL